MNAWNNYFYGPIAAVRPYLLVKVVLVMLAFDTWLAMAPHGAVYGVGGFNIAHFAWLDAIQPVPTPGYYMTLLLFTGVLAMVLAMTGMNRLAATALFLLYTYSWLMSRLDSYTHHYLISLLLFCFIFFPKVKTSDLFSPQDAHDGPYTSGWGYTLLGASVGIVFFWCTMAKVDSQWRTGQTLLVMRGTESLYKPIEQFFSQFGIDHAMFWRMTATMVIVVEALLALCYLVAVTQDRSRRRLVRVCCWLGLVLAVGLHINNELLELYIRWLSYYMIVIACAFFLPQSWMRRAAVVLTWPGRRFEQWLVRSSDRWPVMQSGAVLLVAALVIALGTVFVGRVIDLPGAPAACAVAAVGLVVVTIWAVCRASPAMARQGIIAVAVTGVAMWVAIANSSVRAKFYTSRGNDLKLLEKPQRALDAYKKAVRYAPRGYADPSYNLGIMLASLGQTARAVELYEQTLRIDRNHVEAHNNLGVKLFEQGKYERAMEHYYKALRLQPNHVLAHVNVGNVLQVFGQTDEAMQYYHEALTLDPKHASAHFNLALLLADLNKLDSAIEHLRQALSINPRDSATHYSLGSVLQELGRFEEAVTHYKEALQLNPATIEARSNIAWILATCPDGQVRDGQRALDLAQRVSRSTGHSNARVLDILAAAYAEVGNFEAAVRWQEKAIRLAPDGPKNILRGRLNLYRSEKPFRSTQ